jgi:hypothetical protein
MMVFKDPPRLCEKEDAPRELRNWLERARNDGLSAGATAQLIQAVQSRSMAVEPSAAGPTGAEGLPTVGAGSSTTPLVKVLAAVATIGFGVGAGYVLLHHHAQSALSSSRETASEQTSVASPMEKTEVAPLAPLNSDDDSTGSESMATSVTQPSRVQVRPIPTRAAHSSESGAAPVNDQKRASPSVSADPASARADEYRLLRTARRELSSNPGQALELTRDHAKQFPKGTLIQEREAIAIEALMRLGRSGEAKSRANRFFSQFPASPYRSHLTELVSPSDQRGPGQ